MAIDIKEKKYSGCLYPMVMVKDGVNPSGKTHWKMIGLATELDFNDPDRQIVPCGHCINCRLAYSRQWADRLMLEKEYHEDAWFVTLTYNPFFVPTSYFVDENTGELMPAYSLVKRDVQLFMKRLRELSGQKIRFYAAGEYGGKTFRPHYHLIIFGLHLDKDHDLYNPRYGHSGFTLWQSRLVERAWSKILFDRVWPIGNVSVAPVNWQTCAYVARYVTKKLDGEMAQYYEYFNIERPFSLMSRKPGIAKQYYLDHPEFMEKGSVFLSTPDGSKKIRVPKYFDRLFEVDFPDESAIMKEVKKLQAQRYMKAKRDTDLSLREYLDQEAERAERIASKLIRDEI